ncbi:MAG: primosomal protein N' [Saprospiraceae bacterium]
MEQTSHLVVSAATRYADVVLPLALSQTYTYRIPEELVGSVKVGVRVEVQFGKKRLFTGIVQRVHGDTPEYAVTKFVISVLDETPIVFEQQLALWNWMASYYLSTIGEVMHAALPANFKLSSETRVTLGPLFHQDPGLLSDKEYLVAEALSIQEELSIEDIQGILDQKTVYPIIKSLLDKRIIYLQEEMQEKYQPKQVWCVRFAAGYMGADGPTPEVFELVKNAEKQERTLLALWQLSRQQEFVRQAELVKTAGTDTSVVKALVKKGILETWERAISRIGSYEEDTVDAQELSTQQVAALHQISTLFEQKEVVLLHGVTGSGKTRVYMELMQEAIAKGQQVLYMLPEIALTTQITERVRKVLGNDVLVYHSRLNHNERVELWNKVKSGHAAVVGPRSALFMPYTNLSLVIVDEEHDPSYKQRDPSPRYHGRDTALVLARQFGAKVLLGTATPSLESYFNAQSGKYGLVKMQERFGGVALPEIVIADKRKARLEQRLHNHFTADLLDALRGALAKGEQAILFQNRRGYAPSYRCPSCDWRSTCINCDVSLTYHKFKEQLKCHYCGYSSRLPEACPACGSTQLVMQGFGTEKIEDELLIFLPEARVGRMDLDTVKGKNAHAKIIGAFEDGEIDILVGTQMVTKGLDFERVGVVGVLSADQLLQFPDFRAAERAFQLMVQVAGRAGRKHRQGKVIIQVEDARHPVIGEVVEGVFSRFYQREIQEREQFAYPPFYRLIRITLKHTVPKTVNDAMQLYAHWLRQELGDSLLGPAVPLIGRVRTWYLLDVMVKIDRNDNARLAWVKTRIRIANDKLLQTKGFSGVRIAVDVDP